MSRQQRCVHYRHLGEKFWQRSIKVIKRCHFARRSTPGQEHWRPDISNADHPTPEAVNYRCCYRKLCLFRHSAFNGPSEYACTYTLKVTTSETLYKLYSEELLFIVTQSSAGLSKRITFTLVPRVRRDILRSQISEGPSNPFL